MLVSPMPAGIDRSAYAGSRNRGAAPFTNTKYSRASDPPPIVAMAAAVRGRPRDRTSARAVSATSPPHQHTPSHEIGPDAAEPSVGPSVRSRCRTTLLPTEITPTCPVVDARLRAPPGPPNRTLISASQGTIPTA